MLADQTDALPNLLLVGYEEFAYLWGNYLGMSHMEVQDISYAEVNRKLVMKQWKENYHNFTEMMELYGFTEDEWYGWGQEIESPYEENSSGNVSIADGNSKLYVESAVSDTPGDWFDTDYSISGRARGVMDAGPRHRSGCEILLWADRGGRGAADVERLYVRICGDRVRRLIPV